MRYSRLALLFLLGVSTSACADIERFAVFSQGTNIGRVVVETRGTRIKIDLDVKDNGRGPTMAEELTLDANGLPDHWKIAGTQTFGGKIDESFERADGVSSWHEPAGPGRATGPAKLYIANDSSPFALQVYARALIRRAARSTSCRVAP